VPARYAWALLLASIYKAMWLTGRLAPDFKTMGPHGG
jgi:hypothetical protein